MRHPSGQFPTMIGVQPRSRAESFVLEGDPTWGLVGDVVFPIEFLVRPRNSSIWNDGGVRSLHGCDSGNRGTHGTQLPSQGEGEIYRTPCIGCPCPYVFIPPPPVDRTD
jgi:hypothetical protein